METLYHIILRIREIRRRFHDPRLVVLLPKRLASIVHHTTILIVRANRYLDGALIDPVTNHIKVATRMQRRRVDGQRAVGHPLKRHGRGLGMALEVDAQDLDAVVDVVPALVVDAAVVVEQRGVVPLRVEGAPDRGQAVQVVEDDQADHVLVLVFFDGDVLRLVQKVAGFFLGKADVVTVCWLGNWLVTFLP